MVELRRLTNACEWERESGVWSFHDCMRSSEAFGVGAWDPRF